MAKSTSNQILLERATVTISNLVSSVVLARTLGVETYGFYATVMTNTTLLLKFSTLGSSTYLNTLASHNTLNYKAYKQCWKISLIGAISTLITTLSFVSWTSPRLIIPSCIASITYIFSTRNLLHALYIGQGKYSLISKSIIIESLARIVIVIVFAYSDLTLLWLLFFLSVPQLLSYLFLWKNRISSVKLIKSVTHLKEYKFIDILKASLVLVLGAGFLGVFSGLPVIVISKNMNYEIAALFSVYTASALTIIDWFSSRISNDQKSTFRLNENEFIKSLSQTFKKGVPVIIISCFAVYVFISIAYGSRYHTSPFVILSLSAFALVKLLSMLEGQRLKYLRMERLGYMRYLIAIIIFLWITLFYKARTYDLNLVIYTSSISLLIGIMVSLISTSNFKAKKILSSDQE